MHFVTSLCCTWGLQLGTKSATVRIMLTKNVQDHAVERRYPGVLMDDLFFRLQASVGSSLTSSLPLVTTCDKLTVERTVNPLSA
jgi:hypothetical protein